AYADRPPRPAWKLSEPWRVCRPASLGRRAASLDPGRPPAREVQAPAERFDKAASLCLERGRDLRAPRVEVVKQGSVREPESTGVPRVSTATAKTAVLLHPSQPE